MLSFLAILFQSAICLLPKRTPVFQKNTVFFLPYYEKVYNKLTLQK